MSDNINLVVFFPQKKEPIMVKGFESQELVNLIGEAWLKLKMALRNFPNKEENVHTIEVYMPGASPQGAQIADPYHECQFYLTECGVPGFIRSLMTAQ